MGEVLKTVEKTETPFCDIDPTLIRMGFDKDDKPYRFLGFMAVDGLPLAFSGSYSQSRRGTNWFHYKPIDPREFTQRTGEALRDADKAFILTSLGRSFDASQVDETLDNLLQHALRESATRYETFFERYDPTSQDAIRISEEISRACDNKHQELLTEKILTSPVVSETVLFNTIQTETTTT